MSDTNRSAEKFEESGYSEEEYKQLEQLYSGTMGKINAGEIIKGRVVHIGDSNVAVDIGFKSEGNVSVSEFPKIKELSSAMKLKFFSLAFKTKMVSSFCHVSVPISCASGNVSSNHLKQEKC